MDEQNLETLAQRCDSAAADVAALDAEIAAIVAKQQAAARSNDRKVYDKSVADLSFAGARRKILEEALQTASAEHERAQLAQKRAELEEVRARADYPAAMAAVGELIADAKEHARAIAALHSKALQLAERQREDVGAVRRLSAEVGVLVAVPEIDDWEINRTFRDLRQGEST